MKKVSKCVGLEIKYINVECIMQHNIEESDIHNTNRVKT